MRLHNSRPTYGPYRLELPYKRWMRKTGVYCCRRELFGCRVSVVKVSAIRVCGQAENRARQIRSGLGPPLPAEVYQPSNLLYLIHHKSAHSVFVHHQSHPWMSVLLIS